MKPAAPEMRYLTPIYGSGEQRFRCLVRPWMASFRR